MSPQDKAKKANTVCDLLAKKFPVRPQEEPPDLVEALLAAILMDKVSQAKAEQAINRLQTAFVDWNEARVSTGGEIAEEARDSGINERVGRNLRNALHALYDDRWEFDLDFLKEESFANIRAYLLDTMGLEPRAAGRLMLLWLSKPALPMTEEVRRVANRVGLVDGSWTQERAQKSLERVIPSSKMLAFYHGVTQHAEMTCLSTRPKCSRCLLRKRCDYYADQQAESKKPKRATKARKTAAPSSKRKEKRAGTKKKSTRKKARTTSKKTKR